MKEVDNAKYVFFITEQYFATTGTTTNANYFLFLQVSVRFCNRTYRYGVPEHFASYDKKHLLPITMF